MRCVLSIFVAALFSFSAAGQVGITSAYSCPTYTLTGTVSGITPTDIGLYSDDLYSGVLSVGFTFSYYGTPHTQFIVGENGLLFASGHSSQ
jgi:hypothetical protein